MESVSALKLLLSKNHSNKFDTNDNNLLIEYFKELNNLPVLKPNEEINILKAAKNGDEISRKKIIESNLKLVVAIAKRYINSGVPLIDLIQEGNLGLINAITKFDMKRNNKFSTYAVWQIRHYIRRAIANKGRLIRIPVNLIEKRKRIEQVIETIITYEGREPSIEEISKHTSIPKSKVKKIINYFQPLLSLEVQFNKNIENEESHYDVFGISYEYNHPENKVFSDFLKHHLINAINTLDERESKIFKCYYGLEDEHTYTLKELGKMFNLTRERIRQIKNNATKKIKEYFINNAII